MTNDSEHPKYPKYPIRKDNYYELLGFIPLSKYSLTEIEKAYKERFEYWSNISTPDKIQDKIAALEEITKARHTLIKDATKSKYDEDLKQRLMGRLKELIVVALKNGDFDHQNQERIEQKGRQYGLQPSDITICIDETLQTQRAKHITAKVPMPALPKMVATKIYPYPITAANYYALLGFVPLSKPSKDEIQKAFDERFTFWRGLARPEMLDDKATALQEISQALNILSNDNRKTKYDERLKEMQLDKLNDIIEAAIDNNELSLEQRIHKKGLELGLTQTEVNNCIDKVLQQRQVKHVTVKPKIFISHAWEDKLVVRDLENYLGASGAEVWVDHSSVQGGDNLIERISYGLDWCNVFLLVFSEAASKSRWVIEEWRNAYYLDKRIIPCLLDNSSLPTMLASKVYIDFRDFQNGLEKLLDALRIQTSPNLEQTRLSKESLDNHYAEVSQHKKNGILNLLNGNYQIAAELIKKSLALNPDDTFLNVVLGVSLSNGKSLRELNNWSLAKEIHRHFSLAYDNPQTRSFATVAFVVLKTDYFKYNSVDDSSPFLHDLLPKLPTLSISSQEKDIILKLNMSDKAHAEIGF